MKYEEVPNACFSTKTTSVTDSILGVKVYMELNDTTISTPSDCPAHEEFITVNVV